MHLQQQQKRIDEGNAAHRSVPRAKVFSTVGKPLTTSLVRWYRAGEDVGALMPRLSTYLGHRDVCSTFWCLWAAPELLALAAGRLEADPEGRP